MMVNSGLGPMERFGMTRKLLAATVLASMGALSSQGQAQPVTGLYIGGAGGANFLQRETFKNVNTTPVGGTYAGFQTGYAALGSVGYGFGNGLRIEVEGNYRHNQFGSPSPLGRTNSGYEEKYGGMGNVLFDLDIGSPYVYPYIGGGAGYAEVKQRQTALFAAPGFAETDRLTGSRGAFAYQAIAGLSLPIPPVVGLSLTVEYRFYALAGSRNFTDDYVGVNGGRPFGGATQVKTTDNYNHSLMLGLRYAFFVPRPPVEAAAPVPVASSPAARTYLVFFDWDRADLTDRARQIIAEAAKATTQVRTTRIEVSGNTDTTGTAQYNQGLSVRRAQNVAAELVRDGVPRAAITTQGFGFSRLLVSTGPGVREPQNRRVEIVLR